MPESLGQRLVGAGIDEADIVQASEGQDAPYLSRGIADEKASAPASHQLVGHDDRRDPGGVDEVTPLEAYEDFEVLHGRGFEPLLKLVGDGEVQLALHANFATSVVEVDLADAKRTYLH